MTRDKDPLPKDRNEIFEFMIIMWVGCGAGSEHLGTHLRDWDGASISLLQACFITVLVCVTQISLVVVECLYKTWWRRRTVLGRKCCSWRMSAMARSPWRFPWLSI